MQVVIDPTTVEVPAVAAVPAVGDVPAIAAVPARDAARAACASPDPAPLLDTVQPQRECPADLTNEAGPFGRRKLLIALPEEHKLVLLDAQTLLDSPPGQFGACTIEATYPLQATLPSTPPTPDLPDDLQATPNLSICPVTPYPAITATAPTPGGMALSGNQLYVADRSLPVVHVLDVTDPCAAVEQPPLLPEAYSDPNRVVTTSRVAVSPLTPTGKQYVYAIDEKDQPSASIMVFDISAGTTSRTPVIFPGSPRQPYSPPDRIRFSAPVRDVSFVIRDFPEPDPVTGVGVFGVQCDPNPAASATSPGALYRPASDFTDGARPVNLRGVFGFAMLTNGQIPIIDVEDFDAPCRRPIYPNPTSVVDFRGCPPDVNPPPYFTTDETSAGTATVTDESSCNVIEPNRARDANLSISDSLVGLHAPTLGSLPQFSNPDPSAVLEPADQPHMLAVDFPNPAGKPVNDGLPFPAQVNISGQLYAACSPENDPFREKNPPPSVKNEPPPCDTAQVLPNDPTAAIENSLTLPLVEPRSYAANEAPTATFEGKIMPDRTSGFLSPQPDGSWWIQDPDASFCSAGVEDSKAILVEAAELGIPSSSVPQWADAHADYVQITGDFLPYTDAYWSRGAGRFCADMIKGTTNDDDGFGACTTEFGNIEDPTALKETRELEILGAFTDHLVVGPRNGNSLDNVRCCFPSGTSYSVRASKQWFVSSAAGLHDISAAADGSCVHTASCDPRKQFFHSRAFEVCDSNVVDPPGTKPTADSCLPTAANVGCVHPFSTPVGGVATPNPVEPGGDASQCIFENLTSRFVIYRGKQPSSRDMSFSWTTTGGFAPLAMSLTTVSNSVNPQAISYIPELGYLAVVDGSTLGLSLFDLNSLGVVSPSPFY